VLTNLFEGVGTLREHLHRIREARRSVTRSRPCPGRRGQRPAGGLRWGEDDVWAEESMMRAVDGTHDHPSIERQNPQAQQPRVHDGANDRLAADLVAAPPASEPDGAGPPLC
jgi:hypothetical protein